jgi:striatin 1/3/4
MAYQNAVAKIFDIESGKEVVRLQSDMSYGAFFISSFDRCLIVEGDVDGTPATQINRIVSHPTMPLLITAHEDNNEKQMTAMHNTG